MFKLALAQMRVDGGAKAVNLARAEAFIARAADAAEMFAAENITKVMNTYNPDPAGPEVE